MNSKAQANPMMLVGIAILIVAVIAVFMAVGGMQLPSFSWEMLSLRTIFCGGVGAPPPITYFFNWLGYLICTTALPVAAAIVFAIIMVAWAIEVFPPILAAPPLLLIPAIIGFVIGFIVANFVLMWWWALILIGIVIGVIRWRLM